MPNVVSIPCLAAALLLVTACDGFHAGYVSAGTERALTGASVHVRAAAGARSRG